MKKACIVILVLGFLAGGCASYVPRGALFTEVQGPMGAGKASVKCSKVGRAEAQSVLGLVATGDASIQTAARNGGITKIHYVDWHVQNILGIIGRYTTVVYGE